MMTEQEKRDIVLTSKLYDSLTREIQRNYPLNDTARVVGAEKYLLQVILDYKPTPNGLKSHLVRGVCAEVMFEIVTNYYRNYYDNFTIFKNLVIPLERGGTTQLDFVILSPKSIIVVEVKSLFGNIDVDKDIITSSYLDYNKNLIEKDIKPWNQNLMHIIALKKHLKIYDTYVHNGVFLFSAGRIVTIDTKQDNHLLTLSNTMAQLEFLMNHKDMGKPIPKKEMMRLMKGMNDCIPTYQEEIDHVANLKKIHA